MVTRPWIVPVATMLAACGGGGDDAADGDASVDADVCRELVSTASPGITQIEVARVDGDDIPDLLVHGDRNPGEQVLRFLRGRGDGTFTSPWSAVPAVRWWDFFVADVNGDQRADVIFGAWGQGSTMIGVLTGNGDGTFSSGFSVAGEYARVAGVRSVNGDAHPDIVAIVSEGGETELRLYLGDGAGGFTNAASYTISGATQLHHGGAVGDFDEDFDVDVAVAADDHIVTYSGNGTGTFETTVSAAYPFSSPRIVAVADIDRTGSDDLLAVGGGRTQLQVLLGQLPGPFSDSRRIVVEDVVNDASVGDIDRDDNLDLVASSLFDGIKIARGRGDGTFEPARDILTSEGSVWHVAVGDADGDAKNDIIYQRTDEDTVKVLFHDCIP